MAYPHNPAQCSSKKAWGAFLGADMEWFPGYTTVKWRKTNTKECYLSWKKEG